MPGCLFSLDIILASHVRQKLVLDGESQLLHFQEFYLKWEMVEGFMPQNLANATNLDFLFFSVFFFSFFLLLLLNFYQHITG